MLDPVLFKPPLGGGCSESYPGLPIGPNGPGNQCPIAVTEIDNKGFFGEVPADEFITGSALINFIGLTEGQLIIPNIDTIPWLKFFIDNKILFVSKNHFLNYISWNDLNDYDVLTGNRSIQINGLSFRIRCFSGLNLNDKINPIVSNTEDPMITHGSEWNRLMYNICEISDNPNYYRYSQVGTNWETYIAADIGLWSTTYNPSTARNSICYNESSITNQFIHRGGYYASNLYSRPKDTRVIDLGWRPVLELIH